MNNINSQKATTPKLLPCPHCGHQPEFYRCGGYDTFQSVIACCGFTHQDFEEAIIKAWNKRAPLPSGPAERDAALDEAAALLDKMVDWPLDRHPSTTLDSTDYRVGIQRGLVNAANEIRALKSKSSATLKDKK